MRIYSIAFLAVFLFVTVGIASSGPRWLPDPCAEYETDEGGADAERRWNDAYRAGFRAIEVGDYTGAEAEMCRALVAARDFAPRDWRFAETLDELGLIAFQLRDYPLAEQMQGAAIAEMLLATGPDGEPLREHTPSERAVIRQDCRSGVEVYIKRLGWIHERFEGRTTIEEIRRAPWSVFAAGFVPLDSDLARRLDWLVSQYLLREQLDAAESLSDLQRAIGTDRP